MSSQNEHSEREIRAIRHPGIGKSNVEALPADVSVLSANEIDRTAVALPGTHAGYICPWVALNSRRLKFL